MEEIRKQVRRARRRMVLEQFLSIVTWALFVTLLVAVVGLAIPKLWVIGVDPQVWLWSWIGGSVGAGVLTAIIWTYMVRRSALEAAIEIDRRFGLKERVSSTLALGPQDLDSDVGRALMSDAVRRVERINIGEQFRISPTWRNILPLLPAAAVVVLALLPDAVMKKTEAANEASQSQKNFLKKAAQKFEKKISEAQKKGDDSKLKDGEFDKELAKKLNDLANKENVNRVDALIKLNDLAKEVEKKKKDFGGAEQMKKDFEKLKDIEKGPADRFAQALKEGDLGKAQEELKKLAEDLKKGDMKDADKEKLAKQLEKIKEQLQEKAKQRDQAKKDLKEEIKQKMDAGKMEEAEELQKKLDEMEKQDQQMQQKMEQMAEKLGQCAECMKQGGKEGGEQANQEGAQKLQQLAKDLKDIQNELQEMENLDEMLDELADAKDAMGDEGKEGKGKEGDGNQDGKGEGDNEGDPGKGMGKGRGEGERPEEETDKNFYDSRVADNPKGGKSVRIGDADGKNVAGKTRQQILAEVKASSAKDPDAQVETALPRDQREHSKQYFDKFRKGELGGLLEEAEKEETEK